MDYEQQLKYDGVHKWIYGTMLDYKLAKELKDSGFPQEGGDYFDFWLDEGGNGFTRDFKGEIPKDTPRIPTLSELIEACGDRFGYLARFEKGNPDGDWQMISRDSVEIVWSITPEEAVAKLWLALNKK